jgi:adenosine deaminase
MTPRDLRALPKVHLHVHLEGTIRPSTLLAIAHRHGAQPPGETFANLASFFVNYQRVRECLHDPEDFQRIAYELCQDEAAQGVRYAEVTFSPAFHGLRLGDWDMPIQSILEGFLEGAQAFGIRCRLVLDHSRRRPLELAEKTLELALRYRDSGVIGLGLGGPEADYPPQPYARVFEKAVDGGLHSVPHAGEEAGPASIRGALDALRAERLGHGVRVLEDADLVAEVRERRVPLEVCPSINVLTGIFPSVQEHPLPRLLGEGLVVTLNADVPAMTASPLGREYELARETFNLTDETLSSIARAGVQAAFLPDADRADLHAEIDAWLTDGLRPSRDADALRPARAWGP